MNHENTKVRKHKWSNFVSAFALWCFRDEIGKRMEPSCQVKKKV
jgi:hypothetical protein